MHPWSVKPQQFAKCDLCEATGIKFNLENLGQQLTAGMPIGKLFFLLQMRSLLPE